MTSLLMVRNISAQKYEDNKEEIEISVTANVVFIDRYLSEIQTTKDFKNGYLILLEINDTNSICYKHIVAFYGGNKELAANKRYRFNIVKTKTQSHYIEDIKNDTVYIIRLEGMPTRLSCKHRVLADPYDYEYEFLIKSVSNID